MISIILDCRRLARDPTSELACECLVRLTKSDPGLECFILRERFDDPEPASFAPVKPLQMATSFWNRWRISSQMRRLLRKYQTKLLIGNPPMETTRLPVPYGFLVGGQSLQAVPAKASHRVKKSWSGAAVILTDSVNSQELIIERFSVQPDKVVVLSAAPNEYFRPLDQEQKNGVRAFYTGSKDYFFSLLQEARPEQLTHLLKAFAIFKKKQQSNMHLVIAGISQATMQLFSAQKDSFRYRDDLHFLGALTTSETARLMASSYGLIQAFDAHHSMTVLNAFQALTPVIAVKENAIREVAGDAILYTTGTDYEALATQMILLYKDEGLRSHLIENGRTRLQHFNWEKSMIQFRAGILKAIQGYP